MLSSNKWLLAASDFQMILLQDKGFFLFFNQFPPELCKMLRFCCLSLGFQRVTHNNPPTVGISPLW